MMNLRGLLCKMIGCHEKETRELKNELGERVKENEQAAYETRRAGVLAQRTAASVHRGLQNGLADPLRLAGRMRRLIDRDQNDR